MRKHYKVTTTRNLRACLKLWCPRKSELTSQNEVHKKEKRTHTTEGCEEVDVAKNLVAVIGPLAAAGAAEVNSLLSLFRIPEIGYSFTGQEMGLRGRMNFYVSVVPMDQAQARAMIDLVRHFNWTYVSVMYTDGKPTMHSLFKLH